MTIGLYTSLQAKRVKEKQKGKRVNSNNGGKREFLRVIPFEKVRRLMMPKIQSEREHQTHGKRA